MEAEMTLPTKQTNKTDLTTDLSPGSGLENITPEDIGIQYLKYNHGKMECLSLGIERDEIICRILTSTTSRAYYENKEPQPGKSPDCKSYNGLVPADSILIPQSKYCKEQEPTGKLIIVCEKAKWHTVEVAGEKKTFPPSCNESLNLVLIMEDLPQMAFVLPLRGKFAKENGKNFLVKAKVETLQSKLSLCDARVKIRIEKDKEKNQYFIPTFEILEWTPDKEIQRIFNLMYNRKPAF